MTNPPTPYGDPAAALTALLDQAAEDHARRGELEQACEQLVKQLRLAEQERGDMRVERDRYRKAEQECRAEIRRLRAALTHVATGAQQALGTGAVLDSAVPPPPPAPPASGAAPATIPAPPPKPAYVGDQDVA